MIRPDARVRRPVLSALSHRAAGDRAAEDRAAGEGRGAGEGAGGRRIGGAR